MQTYFIVTILLNILVEFLLLMGANRLAGFPHQVLRCAMAAGISGMYAGVCLEMPLFGGPLWRFAVLTLVTMAAYGFSKTLLRRGVLFVLLHLAVDGIASGFSGGGFGILAAAAVVGLLCLLGFGGKAYGTEYIPVELCYGTRKLRLLAIRDTGNMLRDPISGQGVLVVDAAAGETLLGLTQQQLWDPASAVASAAIPGLRLLPYRSIGSPKGMLLAIRLENTKIGNTRGSAVVAFAPQKLDSEGIYRGLTGGMV